MEVTIWIKRNRGRCDAAIRKGEAIEPRKLMYVEWLPV